MNIKTGKLIVNRFADYVKSVSNDTDFYKLSEAETIALKKCLLDMYHDISRVCEKYNLCIMFGGGSALGAIRHQGFIPWDDDMDLMMPRLDYNKLLKVADSELEENYIILGPNRSEKYSYFFLRLMKKNTVMKTLTDGLNDSPGIAIDITPIEAVPNHSFGRFLFGINIRILQIIIMSIKKYKERNPRMLKLMTRSFKTAIIYYLVLFCGFIFSCMSLKKWYKLFDSIASSGKGTQLATIPTGRAGYFEELLPKEVFLPVSKGIFEGIEINLPHNPDVYLSNLYGDYMKIPLENKRERHYYVAFSSGSTE